MSHVEYFLGRAHDGLVDPSNPGDVFVALISLSIALECLAPKLPKLLISEQSIIRAKRQYGDGNPPFGFAQIGDIDPGRINIRAVQIKDRATKKPVGVNLELLRGSNFPYSSKVKRLERELIPEISRILELGPLKARISRR